MNTAVTLLAIIGAVAVLLRLLRAVWALIHGGVDGLVARELAETRAHRGDVTGAIDAGAARAAARRRRFTATGMLFFWSGLLLVPPLTPWPALLYAAYSLLWLLPRRGLVQRRTAPGQPPRS